MDSTQNAPVQWPREVADGGTSTRQHPTHHHSASGNSTPVKPDGFHQPTGSSTTNQPITVFCFLLPAHAGADTFGLPADTVQLSGSGGVSYAWAPVEAVDQILCGINPSGGKPNAHLDSDVIDAKRLHRHRYCGCLRQRISSV
ncbi:MAG: hypothetical protein IPP17_30625 [Bacteroidetes bacterium]|nr:hypothetical protein [Bacteroidota bacterium]